MDFPDLLHYYKFGSVNVSKFKERGFNFRTHFLVTLSSCLPEVSSNYRARIGGIDMLMSTIQKKDSGLPGNSSRTILVRGFGSILFSLLHILSYTF